MKQIDIDQLMEAISLIQEARYFALLGEYGSMETEYQEVRQRFDKAIEILQELISYAQRTQ